LQNAIGADGIGKRFQLGRVEMPAGLERAWLELADGQMALAARRGGGWNGALAQECREAAT
jgi:hypothetical protein